MAPGKIGKTTGLIVAFLAVALMGPRAWAHATLVSAEPGANTEVAAPSVLQLHFSEAFEPKFSSFKLTDTDGTEVALKPVRLKDPKTLAATPAAPLEPGLYTITWTTVGHDTHKRTGTYSFTVK